MDWEWQAEKQKFRLKRTINPRFKYFMESKLSWIAGVIVTYKMLWNLRLEVIKRADNTNNNYKY